jgi:hypothetical protein
LRIICLVIEIIKIFYSPAQKTRCLLRLGFSGPNHLLKQRLLSRGRYWQNFWVGKIEESIVKNNELEAN